MKNIWDNITANDVKKAIELFDRMNVNYPEPRNTFLIYDNKKYPAKHIRGLAYFVANKKEISKSEYSGGQETAIFFKKLGFTVQYKKDTLIPTEKGKTTLKQTDQVEPKKVITKKLNVVSQKNAIQRLLQKHYGHIETEKKFDWLKTPNQENLPKEYSQIVKELSEYRNQNGFQKSNYQLLCDIVLDDHKLIIEYDENQHFSKARQITLENYPPTIKLHFSKETWISACNKINAKDNNPIDRDEKRAFYDTVRDIEAFRHGYKLVRIKHGDIDWEADGAEKHLKKIFAVEEVQNETNPKHKIARLIVTGKQYDKYGNANITKLEKLIEKFLATEYQKRRYEFILTPGGFLTFDFPDSLQCDLDIEKAERQSITLLQKKANSVIVSFFECLNPITFKKLKETADYFTIGIDGFNLANYQHIELVAVYELKSEKVISWTGKFYPTDSQKRDLIKINDLDTHFIELNNQRIVILGCHDLNVFSPRGQANANPNGWKKQLADRFKTQCKKFKPEIILQHPHTTDTPNIWNLAWRTVEKELPYVKHFASGIKYYNRNGVRGDIDKVLEKTKKGDVIDFYYD
jgi:very-short-patch-repair endonuclease